MAWHCIGFSLAPSSPSCAPCIQSRQPPSLQLLIERWGDVRWIQEEGMYWRWTPMQDQSRWPPHVPPAAGGLIQGQCCWRWRWAPFFSSGESLLGEERELKRENSWTVHYSYFQITKRERWILSTCWTHLGGVCCPLSRGVSLFLPFPRSRAQLGKEGRGTCWLSM